MTLSHLGLLLFVIFICTSIVFTTVSARRGKKALIEIPFEFQITNYSSQNVPSLFMFAMSTFGNVFPLGSPSAAGVEVLFLEVRLGLALLDLAESALMESAFESFRESTFFTCVK